MTHESARLSKGHRRSAATAGKSLPFSGIPGQSRLFLDYLAAPGALRAYYPNAVGSPYEASSFQEQVLGSYKTDRGRLCDLLAELNKDGGAGTATLANIELLRGSRSVAVVTGQQAGLFSGPLYSIYKALSAVRLAEELRTNGIDAVPVFWVASEDHDLEEIDHAVVLEKGDGLTNVYYRPAGFMPGSSVGAIGFDNGIDAAIEQMFREMGGTEFSAGVRTSLSDAYRSGETYGSAFTRFLLASLGKYGLIVLDPLHPGIKELATPMFSDAIGRSDEIVAAIRERSRRLQTSGYHAQVLIEDDYFPLFWHDDAGRRLALRSIDHGRFRVKGEKVEFSRDDLLRLAVEQPDRLSPGVMLRPVVQDYILPTLCYFGGGAEIAYFAQNSEAYRLLDRPVTPIFHRQSFTVIEPREQRNLQRFGWELKDLFAGRDAALLNAAEKTLSPDLARLFDSVDENISAQLGRLGERLAGSDPPLADSLLNRSKKILYHISALKIKALRGEVRKDETMRRRIDTLFDSLLPKGVLQERELNLMTFLNKYGPNFIDWIYRSIDLNDKGHRILEL